jgi:hypothetical protein
MTATQREWFARGLEASAQADHRARVKSLRYLRDSEGYPSSRRFYSHMAVAFGHSAEVHQARARAIRKGGAK